MLGPEKSFEPHAPNLKVPVAMVQQLREQLEYYFSLVNLITDKYMLTAMQRSKRGWVSVQELLQFKRIKEMMLSCFEFQLDQVEIEKLMEEALKDSSKLMMEKGQIAPKRLLNWRRDRKRVLYIEGQHLTKLIFFNLLTSLQVLLDSTSTRQGQSWLFAEFPTFNQLQLDSLIQRLTQTAPPELNLKIIKMDEFYQYQRKYEQLIHPDTNYRTKTQIPQQQMLQYDEIPSIRIKIAKDQEIQDNGLDYEDILKHYIENRNPMTPQRYELFRAEKIKQTREGQIQRRKERKQMEMDVQQ